MKRPERVFSGNPPAAAHPPSPTERKDNPYPPMYQAATAKPPQPQRCVRRPDAPAAPPQPVPGRRFRPADTVRSRECRRAEYRTGRPETTVRKKIAASKKKIVPFLCPDLFRILCSRTDRFRQADNSYSFKFQKHHANRTQFVPRGGRLLPAVARVRHALLRRRSDP